MKQESRTVQILSSILEYCLRMEQLGYDMDDFKIQITLKLAHELGLEICYTLPEDLDIRFEQKQKIKH